VAHRRADDGHDVRDVADGYTKVGCGTEERTRAEAHINQVFGAGTASYRIEAARLTVERADGVGVTARAGTWQDVERELDP
jgi:hypothetical protein